MPSISYPTQSLALSRFIHVTAQKRRHFLSTGQKWLSFPSLLFTSSDELCIIKPFKSKMYTLQREKRKTQSWHHRHCRNTAELAFEHSTYTYVKKRVFSLPVLSHSRWGHYRVFRKLLRCFCIIPSFNHVIKVSWTPTICQTWCRCWGHKDDVDVVQVSFQESNLISPPVAVKMTDHCYRKFIKKWKRLFQ